MRNIFRINRNKKDINADFEAFKKDISWFIKKTDEVEFLNKNGLIFSEEFKSTFPELAHLIEQSRVLNLRINNNFYRLISWTNIYNQSCGWLCKIEDKNNTNLLKAHSLILMEIGGIKESYNEPDDCLCSNQNFLFLESNKSIGMNYWEEYYKNKCAEENTTPLDYSNSVTFAQEANGNLTLYDKNSKEVFLFAPDHFFENVTPINKQPDYTFYRINGIKNFNDYVKKLTEQWKEHILILTRPE